jgi:hypothetical protein
MTIRCHNPEGSKNDVETWNLFFLSRVTPLRKYVSKCLYLCSWMKSFLGVFKRLFVQWKTPVRGVLHKSLELLYWLGFCSGIRFRSLRIGSQYGVHVSPIMQLRSSHKAGDFLFHLSRITLLLGVRHLCKLGGLSPWIWYAHLHLFKGHFLCVKN